MCTICKQESKTWSSQLEFYQLGTLVGSIRKALVADFQHESGYIPDYFAITILFLSLVYVKYRYYISVIWNY